MKLGFIFAFRTSFVVGFILLFLHFLPEYQFANPEPQNERILLVIFGGILAGLGKAISFRAGASTGDEDILAAYFSLKTLQPVSRIVVGAAVFSILFGVLLMYIKTKEIENVINILMYTSIYIFMSAETLNNLYNKFNAR